MDKSQVRKRLAKLARLLVEIIERQPTAFIATEEIDIEGVDQFEYKDGRSTFRPISDTESRHIIDSMRLRKTLESDIRSTEQYLASSKIIQEKYSLNKFATKMRIDQLLWVIARDWLQNGTKNLMDIIDYFLGFLKNEKAQWHVRVLIKGVWMEDDDIVLDDGFIIRKPRPNDFVRKQPMDLKRLSRYTHGPPRLQYDREPSAVVEIHRLARNQSEIFPIVQAVPQILRLFKVGSVKAVVTFYSCESPFEGGSSSWPNVVRSPAYEYKLSIQERDKLKIFFSELEDKITPRVCVNPTIDELTIALERLNKALLDSPSLEERFLFAIMALEALLLGSSERLELRHRLGQRVSRLLAQNSSEALSIYDTVSRSYGVRSAYVHGSQVKRKKGDDLEQLARKILDVARRTIVNRLKSSLSKKQLIAEIDEAIISGKEYEDSSV